MEVGREREFVEVRFEAAFKTR